MMHKEKSKIESHIHDWENLFMAIMKTKQKTKNKKSAPLEM